MAAEGGKELGRQRRGRFGDATAHVAMQVFGIDKTTLLLVSRPGADAFQQQAGVYRKPVAGFGGAGGFAGSRGDQHSPPFATKILQVESAIILGGHALGEGATEATIEDQQLVTRAAVFHVVAQDGRPQRGGLLHLAPLTALAKLARFQTAQQQLALLVAKAVARKVEQQQVFRIAVGKQQLHRPLHRRALRILQYHHLIAWKIAQLRIAQHLGQGLHIQPGTGNRLKSLAVGAHANQQGVFVGLVVLFVGHLNLSTHKDLGAID